MYLRDVDLSLVDSGVSKDASIEFNNGKLHVVELFRLLIPSKTTLDGQSKVLIEVGRRGQLSRDYWAALGVGVFSYPHFALAEYNRLSEDGQEEAILSIIDESLRGRIPYRG